LFHSYLDNIISPLFFSNEEISGSVQSSLEAPKMIRGTLKEENTLYHISFQNEIIKWMKSESKDESD